GSLHDGLGFESVRQHTLLHVDQLELGGLHDISSLNANPQRRAKHVENVGPMRIGILQQRFEFAAITIAPVPRIKLDQKSRDLLHASFRRFTPVLTTWPSSASWVSRWLRPCAVSAYGCRRSSAPRAARIQPLASSRVIAP